ncbi:hypothetical protein [Sphingobium sp. MK2]|uniref:hypothetical protein n=1 Tax=Sphingobium sp. MK2 TaxID=3116540 RepID=UPI0032E35EC2
MIDAASFNRAMTLWFELTGLDPNAKSMTFGDWEWRRASEEMKESMELDPTLLTTYFLLDAFSGQYFREAKITIAEFDADEDKVFDYMAKVREFKKLIRAPEIMRAGDEFIERLRLAMLSYGFAAADIHKVLDRRDHVAFLRRDALLSAKRLRSDHFLQGDVDHEAIKPIYNEKVFSYWNVNSMVDHLCGMPSGISLNLIRDPDELFSYFTIGIRNGANVITLTDVPEYAHPMGRDMSRRPDREFASRAGKNWFPYQFLKIAYDEDGNPFHDKYRESKEKGLTPHQPHHIEIAALNKLDPAQAVWTTLMMDLILDRYWKNPIPRKELSYTGEMIRLENQSKTLVSAARSNLPVVGYQPLNLPRLTVADVKTDALDDDSIGKKGAGHNQWMEDRYSHLVGEAALNCIAAPDNKVRFLSSNSVKPDTFGNGKSLTVIDEVQSMQAGEFKNFQFFNNRERDGITLYSIREVDSTSFGTAARLDADRKFIARYNFARALQMEADREYHARKKEIEKWFEERVRANIENIYPLIVPDALYMRSDANTVQQIASVESMKSKDHHSFGWASFAQISLHKGWNPARCFMNDTAASWEFLFTPRTIEHLCLLTGVPVEELPDILQHWDLQRDYVGNHILDRIDPLHWAATNPWKQMRFSLRIYLSKRARSHIQKNYTAPAGEVRDFHKGPGIILG